MRPLRLQLNHAWILVLAITLGGCQMYGGKPETVDESFALAATMVSTGYDLIGLAFSKDMIDRDKAIELRNAVKATENSLRIAEAAYRNGRDYDQDVFLAARAVLATVRAAIPAT